MCTAFIVAIVCGAVDAQAPVPSKPLPFGIVDNSFLVEEAFNQEPGIVQNIVSFTKAGAGEWTTVFTQEWPIPDITHQFSYTLPLSRIDRRTGVGDVLINYRFQALSETAARPAFAPRLSVVLPTGDGDTGFGSGALGWQVNLPFSKQAGDVYFHWNSGFTYTPHVKADSERGHRATLFSPFVAGSVIWQASPRLNLLLEIVSSSEQYIADDGVRARNDQIVFSPGARHAWNLIEKQIVVGAALPVTVSQDSSVALLAYVSYEVRFKK